MISYASEKLALDETADDNNEFKVNYVPDQ
jgi:hypothetical protein